jgi:hypothetical protein
VTVGGCVAVLTMQLFWDTRLPGTSQGGLMQRFLLKQCHVW